MIYVAYLTTLFLIIFGVFSWRKEKKKKIQGRIAATLQLENKLEDTMIAEDVEKLSFTQRIIQPLLRQAKQLFKQKITNEKKLKIETKLLQAGSPMGMTPVDFRMLQMGMMVVIPLLFGLYAYLLQFSGGGLLLSLLGGFAFAFYLPFYYLKKKTLTRSKLAMKELPDFLDLLTVSIEAGLGFDSALSKVVSKKEGVLTREFQRCLEEMRLGKTRREALSGVRDRLLSDDVKTLIGSIIQAEQLGIGMVQILNVQSVEMRERRKQRAEEQAMKAPIKMLFPLVIFIFPCIFIVLLGPAVIGFLQTF